MRCPDYRHNSPGPHAVDQCMWTYHVASLPAERGKESVNICSSLSLLNTFWLCGEDGKPLDVSMG